MRPILLSLTIALVLGPASARADEPLDYGRDIRPILAKHCYECHGPDKQQAGLRLDSVAAAKEGGNSGAAVVPGKSGESLLIAAVRGDGDVTRMPEDRPPLAADEIERLKQWIDQGATAPADDSPVAAKAAVSRHWAFQPLAQPALPTPTGRCCCAGCRSI
jgi:hypothetical protein